MGTLGSISINLSMDQTSAIVLPKFMDWGPFPAEGTAASPDESDVSGRLASWEIRLISPDGSKSYPTLAGIACFRVGPTSPIPVPASPAYQIFVDPQETEVSWNSSGYQIDAPLVINVTIVRTAGFTAPVNVSLPEMQGTWVDFLAQVNGVPVTAIQGQNVPYTVDAAPDHFTMVFYSSQAGWSLQNWQAGVELIGSDGSGNIVRSNQFAIIF